MCATRQSTRVPTGMADPWRWLARALIGVGLCGPWLGAQALAQRLPQGATVVRGQASLITQGRQLTVHNSDRAILNWQRFSIAPDHRVHFQQPSSNSQVLNRVAGSDPSEIFGQLSSNGRAWLLNPNGILFGPKARVAVAGLVASFKVPRHWRFVEAMPMTASGKIRKIELEEAFRPN